MLFVRENSEGLYAGAGGFLRKGTPDEVALQESHEHATGRRPLPGGSRSSRPTGGVAT